MPQQIRTALGTRWVGTPQDDAERQNVQAQDAWNSVQHQNMWNNSRFQQGQSDARAMNQDNLNYYGARDAQSIAAQAKLAELGFAHDTTMFDKRTSADDARDTRDWARGQPMRDLQGKMLTAQGTEIEANATERARLRANDAGLRAYMATPEGQAAAAEGDFSKASQFVDSTFLLQQLSNNYAKKQGAADAKVGTVAQQAAVLRHRGQEAEAKALEATIPKAQQYALPGADPTADTRGLGEVTEARGAGLIENAVKAVQQHMKQASGQTGLTGLLGGHDPAETAAQLQAAVKREAQVLARQTNTSPLEVERMLMEKLRAAAKTGFTDWFMGTSQSNILDALDEANQ